MLKPQPAVLSAWRTLLVLLVLAPALLISIIFSIGGVWWTCLTLLWVALFLFFYLLYLPRRYRKYFYCLKDARLTVQKGAFYTTTRSLPLQSVQYVTVVISPLDALWHLCRVVVIVPGGRMVIPGLRQEDAGNLTELLSGSVPENLE